MKKVPLTQLSRELAATYDGRTVPGYRKLWMMVVSGELPADQNTNGRYSVDVYTAARILGLTNEKVAA
jgi:hypothetical protein